MWIRSVPVYHRAVLYLDDTRRYGMKNFHPPIMGRRKSVIVRGSTAVGTQKGIMKSGSIGSSTDNSPTGSIIGCINMVDTDDTGAVLEAISALGRHTKQQGASASDGMDTVGGVDGPDSVVEALYQLIWRTAGFRRQTVIIDKIIESISGEYHNRLMKSIIGRFADIESDRRDKFYYLLDRSWGLMGFGEMLGLCDSDVIGAMIRHINRARPADWDDRAFLEFFSYCKPCYCGLLSDVKMEERLVREYLARTDIADENRVALYGLIGR